MTESSRHRVEELTEQEMAAVFDKAARRDLGMSGAEFTRRWHAGQFRDDPDPRVTGVAMLLPGDW